MTATAIPSKPEPVATGDDQLLRIPAIAADLLPAEIVAARRDRASRRMSIIALVGVTAILAAWFGHATYATSVANDRLGRAQETVGRLTRQQSTFTELTSAQSQSALISRQLAQLLASDLPWSTMLTRLQASAPAGVLVTAVFGSLLSSATTGAGAPGAAAGADTAVDPAAAQAPQGQAPRQIGTLTVSATAPDETIAATYVDVLGQVAGLANPFVSDATRQEGVVQFTVRLDITSVALGGRYTSPSVAPSGGK